MPPDISISGAGGRTVVLTGHLDTKPPSHGWTVADPFSGALIDGAIYGQGGPYDVDFDFDELAHPVNAVALLWERADHFRVTTVPVFGRQVEDQARQTIRVTTILGWLRIS